MEPQEAPGRGLTLEVRCEDLERHSRWRLFHRERGLLPVPRAPCRDFVGTMGLHRRRPMPPDHCGYPRPYQLTYAYGFPLCPTRPMTAPAAAASRRKPFTTCDVKARSLNGHTSGAGHEPDESDRHLPDEPHQHLHGRGVEALARYYLAAGTDQATAARLAARYSGHSGRVGFVVASKEAGANDSDVAATTRHRSLEMIRRYGAAADQRQRATH
jgi:hypothetical protein